jgi:hypothetical protein
MYSPDELRQLDLEPFSRGEKADAAILQADHSEYSTWGPDDIVGVRTVLNGRRLSLPKFEQACRVVGVGD